MYSDQFAMSFSGANIFIATALNAQEFDGLDITHLVSMHNDVVPEPGWMDILIDEMEATGADFLSVVLPIKDLNGLSSTAIDSLDNPFCVERRITMTEIYGSKDRPDYAHWRAKGEKEVKGLPPTFSSADCGYPDRALLVNTGLWVLDFTKDWRKYLNADGTLALSVTSPDRIGRRPPTPDDIAKGHSVGRWEAQHSPADWYMSRHLHNVGAKVMATTKVRATHMGDMPYTNMNAWGNCIVDEALKHNFNGIPIGGWQNVESSIGIGPAQLDAGARPAAA